MRKIIFTGILLTFGCESETATEKKKDDKVEVKADGKATETKADEKAPAGDEKAPEAKADEKTVPAAEAAAEAPAKAE